ncbi:hypothetical protein VNO78_08345 [Psophocarpus tetragonolobus]|uniref:Uncharacterized protein n=1 Tax=Psophocarpus tetragonolobus TaxID=3891 RepID=A0AAN9SXS3_PSOTE
MVPTKPTTKDLEETLITIMDKLNILLTQLDNHCGTQDSCHSHLFSSLQNLQNGFGELMAHISPPITPLDDPTPPSPNPTIPHISFKAFFGSPFPYAFKFSYCLFGLSLVALVDTWSTRNIIQTCQAHHLNLAISSIISFSVMVGAEQ